MNIVKDLEEMRKRMICNINTEFDLLIKRAKSEDIHLSDNENNKPYDCTYPLSVGPAFFKGKKPIAVILGDKGKHEIFTWKQLVETILKDCVSDKGMKNALKNLCGKVNGRKRALLSNSSAGMKSPVTICKDLYIETHYDTETLLRILLFRILDVINYDYSKISVVIRND